jgi:MinD-like ATPase involved in chromosome partitioning or flagellar assembly
MQYIPDLHGTVIVTVPSQVSQIAARKASLLSLRADVRVLGIIENMSGYICGKCGNHFDVMQTGGGERLAHELEVPFLGRVPLHPQLSAASDAGVPFVYKYPDNLGSKAVMEIARKLDTFLDEIIEKESK